MLSLYFHEIINFGKEELFPSLEYNVAEKLFSDNILL